MPVPSFVKINKEVGQTPLQALERFRLTRSDLDGLPMTYAGRLDPMASGELLILIGEECKNKERYLGLDKEYEVEIVFGISTDTYDALGLITSIAAADRSAGKISDLIKEFCNSCPTSFDQDYPPYSSKTVKGEQLHALARRGELPEELPNKRVTIYSCEAVSSSKISAGDLSIRIKDGISRVEGDFRQDEILREWSKMPATGSYPLVKVRVQCSGGTYMRSLAHRFGQKSGLGAFALSIKRTNIYMCPR